MKDMLELKDLRVKYDNKEALNGITWKFQENSVYGVVGKSGSGKTTLAKAVAGILPFSGSVTLGDENLNPKVHRIALVPQNHGLIPWKTVADNITLPLKLRGVYREEAFVSVTKELGIDHLLQAWPNHISGGEQQRVAMARAFLAQPHVLILDEAFSALDSITKDEAHQVFLQAYGSYRVTTLLITHDVEEALALSHHVLVLKEGAISAAFENPFRDRKKEECYGDFLSLCSSVKEAL